MLIADEMRIHTTSDVPGQGVLSNGANVAFFGAQEARDFDQIELGGLYERGVRLETLAP
jgi:hypothetical protein